MILMKLAKYAGYFKKIATEITSLFAPPILQRPFRCHLYVVYIDLLHFINQTVYFLAIQRCSHTENRQPALISMLLPVRNRKILNYQGPRIKNKKR